MPQTLSVLQIQTLKYHKIGTCPASQTILAIIEKILLYIENHPNFNFPSSLRRSLIWALSRQNLSSTKMQTSLRQ